MSYGVVCLHCRRYVWYEALGEAARAHTCRCAAYGIQPRLSLDARTEATPEQVAAYYRATGGKHGRP